MDSVTADEPLDEIPAAHRMSDGAADPDTLAFGRYTILPQRRELLAGGRPVELGGRAFDVLLALVDVRGQVLSKEELMQRVWPGRVVEDNNLQVQVAALRRAFAGERDLIRTVAGRGYQFTGQLHGGSGAAAPAGPSPQTNLPVAVSELIGRDRELGEILSIASSRRLVTLTGSGGIGKTRLGLEVARVQSADFADGAWIAELGALADPALVPAAVAAALGLTFAAGALTPDRVAAALGTRQVLLVLDNCEHVIEAAATMAEAVLRAGPAARILATSREPLRADGEAVYRVPSLEVPDEQVTDRELLLQAGAVRLFLARTRAAEMQSSAHARIAAVAAICRRLDGIPLAIELAAARAAALGIEGLAARLDDRFRLLTGGHRTALPRHQTLRATLDWSYDLLPAGERVILCRLAVFAGNFTLESAAAVVAGDEIDAADVVDYVANLVSKSLVTADVGNTLAQYHLLDMTRAYALQKLVESGGLDRFARRHADHYRQILEQSEMEWNEGITAQWLEKYRPQIGNVRIALDWAFSPAGDAKIGAALCAAAAPLWFQLSLINECRGRVEQALAAVSTLPGAHPHRDVRLFSALATTLLYTKGSGAEVNAAWTKALELAESLDDVDYRLRSLWGLWASRINGAEPRLALELARTFTRVATAKTDQADALVGRRMTGLSLYLMGDQAGAREHTEFMLARSSGAMHRSDLIRFQFDQRVMARTTLGHILWIQGFPDQAMQAVTQALEQAQALGHVTSVCNSLAHSGCRVALLNGDLEEANRFVGIMLAYAERHALGFWQMWARCFEGVLMVSRGQIEAGLQTLRLALDKLLETGLGLPRVGLLCEFAENLGRAGLADEGLATIDEALDRSERNGELWCIAELLRIKGELLLQQGAAGAQALAEDHFLRSLDWARRQAALAWELRATMSLARLRQTQSRSAEAHAALAAVLGRFSEGFGTADLRTAAALLEKLG